MSSRSTCAVPVEPTNGQPRLDEAAVRDWIASHLELQRFLPKGATARLRPAWAATAREDWWWETTRFSSSWPLRRDERSPRPEWIDLVDGVLAWPSVRDTWAAIMAHWFLFAYFRSGDRTEAHYWEADAWLRERGVRSEAQAPDTLIPEFVERMHDLESLLRRTTLGARRPADLVDRLERTVDALCFARRSLRDPADRRLVRARFLDERVTRDAPPEARRGQRAPT